METNLMGSAEARVRIVDDEKDFCEILVRVVKQAGFTTLVAQVETSKGNPNTVATYFRTIGNRLLPLSSG